MKIRFLLWQTQFNSYQYCEYLFLENQKLIEKKHITIIAGVKNKTFTHHIVNTTRLRVAPYYQ